MPRGSVTVMLNTPPPASLSIGIWDGRPSVAPKSIAELAVRVVQNTWNVTAEPGVVVDGSAVADAPGELLMVMAAAEAGPAAASIAAPAPMSTRPDLSRDEMADRLIRRMNVPPPKTASTTANTPARATRAGVKIDDFRYRKAGYPVPGWANDSRPRGLWEDRQHAALADRGGVAWSCAGRGLRGPAGRGRGRHRRSGARAGPAPGGLRPRRPDEVRAG